MELLGYEVRDGKVVAIVNYPNARRFTLLPPESAKPLATPELKNTKSGEK
jgi:hypothetical protein